MTNKRIKANDGKESFRPTTASSSPLKSQVTKKLFQNTAVKSTNPTKQKNQ